jgi:ADP-ribosylglycohydrolase
MLLEVAIGDSYGAGFEFVKDHLIEKEHKMDKYYDSRIDNIKAGEYTDDTQMSLAIAELLLTDYKWTPEIVAGYFLDVFHRDLKDGYAKGFYDFLKKTSSPEEFMENINPESVRNGAAMRSVPLGYIQDKEEMLEKAKIQASVTHNTHEGIISSQAVALAAYYFINKIGTKDGLYKYICDETGQIFDKEKTSRTQCCAIETIDAILTVLTKSSSLYEVIDLSVKLGGDTDSVASIACGIASLSDEYSKELPSFMENELENGTYGRDYIKDLDLKLKEKFINI